MKISNSTFIGTITAAALGSGGSFGVIPVPFVKCGVKRIGMVVSGTDANAQGAVVYVTYRALAGDSTDDNNATATIIGILKHNASLNQQGVFIYFRPDEINLYAGQEISFYGHTAQGGSCTADFVIELEDTNENEANNTAMLVTT